MDEMTIGQLAEAARVNVETVRYYQRRGLLATPARPAGSIRRYPPQPWTGCASSSEHSCWGSRWTTSMPC